MYFLFTKDRGIVEGNFVVGGEEYDLSNRSGFDTFAAFFHGVVRETGDVEVGHARRAYIDLHFDEVSVDAIDGSAERLKEHREGSRERLGAA